jgi:UDP-4-amino-4,6-dideoxy-N-acetyl-beta-L-altrosamine transaminase
LIPYGRQKLDQEDIDAVIETLKSSFLTQGPKVPAFEKAICNYIGSQFSLAFNSATSALHAACLALDLAEGDILWTSPISFVASANCGLYCGAKVDFVDIDPSTNNMCPNALEKKLIESKKNNSLPKVVIPVHLSGMPCDMKKISSLAKKYNFKIIEDASHAIGSEYEGSKTGNCIYSDICIFSFHPVKIITTGEGGVALTNCNKLYNKLSLLRTHGITRDEKLMSIPPDGPWYYEQHILGFNYRMTDIQASLGISQLSKINEFIARRREIEEIYDQELCNLPISLPEKSNNAKSSLHLYIIKLKLESANISHKNFFDKLISKGIGVNLHYIPIYRQPYFKKLGFIKEQYTNSELYYSQAMSIPIHPSMSNKDQETVIKAIKDTLA